MAITLVLTGLSIIAVWVIKKILGATSYFWYLCMVILLLLVGIMLIPKLYSIVLWAGLLIFFVCKYYGSKQ